MRQNHVPPTSSLLNSARIKQGLLDGTFFWTRVWLLVLVVAILAPLGYVFAHGQHGNKIQRGEDSERRANIILHSRCAMCHSADIVLQQRLDRRKWRSEIDRMVRWGAPIDDEDQQLLVTYLARHHGTESPETQAEPDRMGDTHVDSATLPQGRAKNGKTLYGSHCADCHGDKGEGHDGPPLAANPILTMDSMFVASVRQGRGGMPPWRRALSRQEIADIQAWLRTLW